MLANWSVTFSPLVPLWIVIALAGAGTLLLAIATLARSRGAVFRLAVLAALVAALLNPTMRHETREALDDIAVVVVDRSLSQQVGHRAERTMAAAANTAEQLERLEALDVRTVTVAHDTAAAEEGTRLFASLYSVLETIPPDRFAGAILITDGQVHDVPDSLAVDGYEAPIHALITGEPGERDRWIVLEETPRYGIVGETQTVRFRVEQTGDGLDDSTPVEVTVRINGRVSDIMRVVPGASVEVPVPIARGGQTITEITAEEARGELTTLNNTAIVETRGIRDRLRVLLISGEPHPGERTWRNLLKADGSVDLVHFTILRPPEKQDGTPISELSLIAFPTRELFSEKLDEFDLIIFDRYQRRGVLPAAYLTNVVHYVERGGALLIAAGPDFASPLSLYRSPLSAVLPASPTGDIVAQPFTAEITETGRRHPVTRDLPGAGETHPSWGRWFRLIDVNVQESDVVLSGPGDRPVLLLSRQQDGRVAQLLSDHFWLWARGFEGGGPQTELLRRLAHWLMQEPDLEEEALIGRHQGGRLDIERRTMADRAGPVIVTTPSGATHTVDLSEIGPGLWRGGIEAEEVGVHRMEDSPLTSVAAVGSPAPKELRDLVATAEPLEPIVSASGGGIYWLARGSAEADASAMPRMRKVNADRASSGSNWLGLWSNNAYRVHSVSSTPLFNNLPVLALLLALLGLAWYREGR